MGQLAVDHHQGVALLLDHLQLVQDLLWRGYLFHLLLHEPVQEVGDGRFHVTGYGEQ